MPRRPKVLAFRHPVLVRVTHWINVLCFVVLLMSGLQIFNAHPALYLGNQSDFDHPIVAIGAEKNLLGGDRGVTTIFGHAFNTTGVLGLSTLDDGRPDARAFPAWAILPSWQSLTDGRIWHLSFAWLLVINGAIYAAYSLLGGHLWRDLIPSRRSLAHIGGTIRGHLLLRFDHGDNQYNSIQQMTYLLVLLVLFPLLIMAGLAMSPRMDAILPWLTPAFGGRQTARTVHFVCAFLLVVFLVVHVLLVILSGPWNNMRSMVTGRYAVRPTPHD